MSTLKSLLENHPEWADLPIVIYDSGAEDYWHVTEQYGPYIDLQNEDEEGEPTLKPDPVLVFSGN